MPRRIFPRSLLSQEKYGWLARLVATMVHSQLPTLNLKFLDVQHQRGSSDCGLYAIALATALCEGKDPCTQLFYQDCMRSHLIECLEMDKMTLFLAKEKSVSFGKRVMTTQQVKLFCHCHQPSCGRMIRCPKCSEWFHRQCEPISQRHWKKPSTWSCSKCT